MSAVARSADAATQSICGQVRNAPGAVAGTVAGLAALEAPPVLVAARALTAAVAAADVCMCDTTSSVSKTARPSRASVAFQRVRTLLAAPGRCATYPAQHAPADHGAPSVSTLVDEPTARRRAAASYQWPYWPQL